MKLKTGQSEVTSRAQAGQRLITLGRAPAAEGEVALPLKGDRLALARPGDVSVPCEVKLGEPGRGKLEVEKWPEPARQHPAAVTGEAGEPAEEPVSPADAPGGRGSAAYQASQP